MDIVHSVYFGGSVSATKQSCHGHWVFFFLCLLINNKWADTQSFLIIFFFLKKVFKFVICILILIPLLRPAPKVVQSSSHLLVSTLMVYNLAAAATLYQSMHIAVLFNLSKTAGVGAKSRGK